MTDVAQAVATAPRVNPEVADLVGRPSVAQGPDVRTDEFVSAVERVADKRSARLPGRRAAQLGAAAAGTCSRAIPSLGSQGPGGRAMIVPSSRWQRAVIVAVLVVPLLMVVVLSAPAWLVWPSLATNPRMAVLQFLDRLVQRVKALAGIEQQLTRATAATAPAGPRPGHVSCRAHRRRRGRCCFVAVAVLDD